MENNNDNALNTAILEQGKSDSASSSGSDTKLNEISDQIDEQSTENEAQINEIRDQITQLQDQQTERNILKTQAEDDQTQLLNEALTENNEYLASIDAHIDLNNHLFTGQFFFIGIFTGVVLFRILFDRLRV